MLNELLAAPNEEDLGMRIIQASFSAAAGTQAAMKVQAPAASIQDLSTRLAEFPRDQWEEIRIQAESCVARTSPDGNRFDRLAALREIWARVTQGGHQPTQN